MKKALSLLLCLAALLTLAACFGPAGEPPVPPSEGDPYASVTEAYGELLRQKKNGEPFVFPSRLLGEGIEEALLTAVERCTDPDAMGYALRDLDKNGTDELILMSRACELFALFTLREGEPMFLAALDPYSAIDAGGTVYSSASDENVTRVMRVAGDKMEGRTFGVTENEDGSRTPFHEVNGERMEVSIYDIVQLNDQLTNVMMTRTYTTKTAGLRFIPALSDAAQENAPVPDVRSYDGILALYRQAVSLFVDFDQNAWVEGEYDRLFRFEDNESYEVYHAILYAAVRMRPKQERFNSTIAEGVEHAYGYAKKDLNSDGTDELILLSDRYAVVAVFTEENGRAVLLDGAYGARIDEHGALTVHSTIGDALNRGEEYGRYVIKDGALVAEKRLWYLGEPAATPIFPMHFYRSENKETTEITAGEFYEMDDEFHTPNRYSDTEYTRHFADLHYFPLTRHAEASECKAGKYVSSSTAGGLNVTLSLVTEDSLTFQWTCSTPVRLNATAQREGEGYRFETDGVKGYVELIVNGVWVVVTESENASVPCRTYLYNVREA